MGDLTKNLSRHEFKCGCGECARTPVDMALPLAIQACSEHFFVEEYKRVGAKLERVAVHITSGYRCLKHNRDIGSHDYSAHVFGMAADHWMEWVYHEGPRKRIPDELIADYYEVVYPNKYGVGRYSTWTHFDVRDDGPARWTA